MILYGHNAAIQLLTSSYERESSKFLGLSTSVGLKFNIIPKWNSYLSLGFNYRFITEKSYTFIDEFNQKHGTDYTGVYSPFFPVLGFTYCFK